MRLVALALLIATSAAAQDAPPAAEPAKPVDFSVVLIELTGKSEYKGVPLICPGDSEPSKPEDFCMSAVHDAPIEIVRRIAGSPSIRGRKLRYKIIEFGFPQGTTILAAVVRTKDAPGLYAPWWQRPDERGEICLDREAADDLQIVPQWSHWKSRAIHDGRGGSRPFRCLVP